MCKKVGTCLTVLIITSLIGTMKGEAGDRYQLTDTLSLSGSVRYRFEVKENTKFDKTKVNNDDQYHLTRVRFNAQWEPSDWFTLFVEGQDTRIYGDKTFNEFANPVDGFVADSFDLHQGYADIKLPDLYNIPAKVRLGRQKLNLGAQRMMSSLEWVNTARSWGAVRVTLGEKEKQMDLFGSHVVPPDFGNFNDWGRQGTARYQNSTNHGIYYTDWLIIPEVQLELYWLMRENKATAASGSAISGGDSVHSFGTRFDTKKAEWDFNGELVGQTGKFSGLDHRAFAAHIEGGYTAQDLNNTRFSLAYNYASGDNDSTDGDHTTFDNFYPLNHAYYGYLDLFAWQNMHNIEATLKTKIIEGKVALRLAYQGFWLVEEDKDSWYDAGRGAFKTAAAGADVDSYAGSEIDFTAQYWVIPEKVVTVVGYSHFFSGSYLNDIETDPGDANFFYVQTKIIF